MIITLQFWVAIVLLAIFPIMGYLNEYTRTEPQTNGDKINHILRIIYYVLLEILVILFAITGVKNEFHVDGKIIDTGVLESDSFEDEDIVDDNVNYYLRLENEDRKVFKEVNKYEWRLFEKGDTYYLNWFE